MADFDVSRKWIILAVAANRNAAEELAAYLGLLRERAGLGRERPSIDDAETFSPPDSSPVIVLATACGSPDRNGFTWRLGDGRLEIHGDSARGLWNGIFDFLAAAGFRWPKPGAEETPPPAPGGVYPLPAGTARSPSALDVRKRRRVVIGGNAKTRERTALIRWAARNKIDALVFSLGEKSFWGKIRRGRTMYDVTRYAFILEAGGCDMSLLLPRHLFFFHRDMFRMEAGKRSKRNHFCPTSPQAAKRIARQAGELFRRALPGISAGAANPVFHLWPDAGREETWCACPACRAFSPTEQNRIAANTAADVLLSIAPNALLSCFEDIDKSLLGDAQLISTSGIMLRKNMFVVTEYQGTDKTLN